jgi:F0F1-type ATP synthase assembly protein I
MPQQDSIFALFARYSAIALILPSSAFVGYVIGYLIDRQFGTGYWSIALLVLGVVAGFVKLIQELQRDKGGG